MKMNGALGFLTLLAATASFAADPISFAGKTSTFSVDHKTLVPGETLKPGSYSIRIIDQIPDRMLVQVTSTTGKEHATFLGVAIASAPGAASSGPLTWPSGPRGNPALRGFSFSGQAIEFVYPKADAVDIATRNSAKVIAIDPPSEGRPELQGMSPEDMKEINLWMLSLTTTGPNNKTPAVMAEKYQGSNVDTQVAMASNPRSTPVIADRGTQVATLDQPNSNSNAGSRMTSSPKQKPVIAQLPHTASQLPLIELFGIIFFMLAGALRLIRTQNRSAA